MIVGASGPWATLGPASVNGLDGQRDGWGVLVVGGIAAIAATILYFRRSKILVGVIILMGAASTALCIYDWQDIGGADLGGGILLASVGWGLQLCVGASVGLIVATIVGVAIGRREPSTASLAPAPPQGDSRVAALAQLSEMRSAGALTDAEFQAEKTRILETGG
jgi:hypothetical protein